MMTPKEMERLYAQLDSYEQALQIIATNDLFQSGDIARRALGITQGDPTK